MHHVLKGFNLKCFFRRLKIFVMSMTHHSMRNLKCIRTYLCNLHPFRSNCSVHLCPNSCKSLLFRFSRPRFPQYGCPSRLSKNSVAFRICQVAARAGNIPLLLSRFLQDVHVPSSNFSAINMH